jgi:orotate phosphoribosyltransferase
MARFEHVEELVVGLYDIGEIGYVSAPGPDVQVKDPDYPSEVFRTLKSGRQSPHYIGGRDLSGFSESVGVPIEQQKRIRDLAIEGISGLLDQRTYDHIVGIPQAMTCFAGLVAQVRGESVLWLRVGEKNYGKHEAIQGHFADGERVAPLDNVTTNAASKFEVAEALGAAGLCVAGFDVLVDREEGGREAIETAGYTMGSIVGMAEITEILVGNGRITTDQQRWSEMYQADSARWVIPADRFIQPS